MTKGFYNLTSGILSQSQTDTVGSTVRVYCQQHDESLHLLEPLGSGIKV